MGRRRQSRGQAIDGVLLLDKPGGMSSNKALQKCRFLLDARKAGHTGSLDPLATGLLPLCFGQATKVSSFLLGSDKSYLVGARLGEITDTGDADGVLLASRQVSVQSAQLEQVLHNATGEYDQVPPMYSALKHQGQPLYKLARQGIEVERKPRRVSAYAIRLLAFEGDSLSFEVDCSSGFYVRSLVEEIGAALGCGAHVTSLRRTRIARLELKDAISLDAFAACETREQRQQMLLPADSLLDDFSRIGVDSAAAADLQHGRAVAISVTLEPGQWIRMYAPDARFLGLGQINDTGQLAPKRLFVEA